MPTKMTSLSEEEREYQREVEAEALAEVRSQDPVRQSVKYHHFVSRSKGRGRKRRNWAEVELVSYRGGPFHLWQNFQFDVYATEVLGGVEDAESKFILQIRQL